MLLDHAGVAVPKVLGDDQHGAPFMIACEA